MKRRCRGISFPFLFTFLSYLFSDTKNSLKFREFICIILLLASLFDSNCNSYCHTNHGVVTCADETHHLSVNTQHKGGNDVGYPKEANKQQDFIPSFNSWDTLLMCLLAHIIAFLCKLVNYILNSS